MEVLTRRGLLAALATAAALGACSRPADQPPQIVSTQAWIRTPPPGAQNAAGYAALTNAGKGPDVLVGASSPAADTVMLHRSSDADGMARMEHVDELALPPGQTQTLRPGGYHLMITGLKTPLAEGARVPIVLRFQRTGERRVEFVVRATAPL